MIRLWRGMRGGGKIDGQLWTAKVKALRAGDHIRCLNWADPFWMGGEVLVVTAAMPTGLRDGYWYVYVYSLDCPPETRKLAMQPDDGVVMVARDVPQSEEIIVPKQTKAKAQKPKKGEQLKLF